MRPRRVCIAAIIARVLTLSLLAVAAPSAGDEGITPLEQFSRPRAIMLDGAVFHVQGLDVDGAFTYLTSVDTTSHRAYLHRFTREGAPAGRVDLTDGVRYHAGGLSLDGTSVWIPMAEYAPRGMTRIVQVDTQSLRVTSAFMVHDHIGAVAVDQDRVYGANWDARRLYVWDRAGHLLARASNASPIAYQDLKVIGHELVAAGPMPDMQSGAVDWLDIDTLRPRRRLAVGKMADGTVWTREGMTLRNGELYLAPSDGDGRPVAIYAFPLALLAEGVAPCAQIGGACLRPSPAPRHGDAPTIASLF